MIDSDSDAVGLVDHAITRSRASVGVVHMSLAINYSWPRKVTGIGWPGRPLTNSGYFLWPRVLYRVSLERLALPLALLRFSMLNSLELH